MQKVHIFMFRSIKQGPEFFCYIYFNLYVCTFLKIFFSTKIFKNFYNIWQLNMTTMCVVVNDEWCSILLHCVIIFYDLKMSVYRIFVNIQFSKFNDKEINILRNWNVMLIIECHYFYDNVFSTSKETYHWHSVMLINSPVSLYYNDTQQVNYVSLFSEEKKNKKQINTKIGISWFFAQFNLILSSPGVKLR